MEIVAKVQGLSELNAALKALPRDVSEKLLNGAVSAGARVIRDETAQRAPIAVEAHFRARGRKTPPGVLKRAIYQVNVKELATFYQRVYRVGVRRGKAQQKSDRDAFYWWWVENGHKIVPRTPKGIFRGTQQSRRNAASTRVSAHPFLRPAFEAKKQAALEAIKAYLTRNIPRAAERVASKRRF